MLYSSNPGLCLLLVILAVAIMESESQDKTRKDTTTETCKVIYTKVLKDRSMQDYCLVLFPFSVLPRSFLRMFTL